MTTDGPPPHGLIRRSRRQLADRPIGLVVLFLAVTVTYAVAHTIVRIPFNADALDRDRILAHLTVGAVVGIAVSIVVARRRSRPSAAPRWVDLAEAVDDGRLPDGAHPPVWTQLLLRRRTQLDGFGGPIALVIAAVLVVASVVWTVVADRPLAWLPAVIVLGCIVVTAVIRRRRLTRIDALLMPLLDAEADDSRAAEADPDTDASRST